VVFARLKNRPVDQACQIGTKQSPAAPKLGFFYGLSLRFGEKEKQDTLILQQLVLHNICAHLICTIDVQRCPDYLQIWVFDVSASNLMTLVALLAPWGR